jgi:predicted N-acetyltransferase YhbS
LRVPAVLLGRLAVDKAMQRQGLGTELMANAIFRSLNNSSGWAMMVVDAKNDKACSFYRKFGFDSLADNPRHLYVSRKELELFITQTVGYNISQQEKTQTSSSLLEERLKNRGR